MSKIFKNLKTVLVTGGAGFIGGSLVRKLHAQGYRVINLDALTYAANPEALPANCKDGRHIFIRGSITDSRLVESLFESYKPEIVFHTAAESHVDRSIDSSGIFIDTNVLGTQVMLDSSLAYWKSCSASIRENFRFVHCSTDEVFGSANPEEYFTEQSHYAPSSPYAASKAASDHLVKAWYHTYCLPTIIANCGNNYGPYQFPEKLIPHLIVRALNHQTLPVYGNGQQQRDWIHVDDHCRALIRISERGVPGESYMIGSRSVRCNLEMVKSICSVLDMISPRPDSRLHRSAIEFVTDRPGHDIRYAINPQKLEQSLGWAPRVALASGLADTISWYVNNRVWWEKIISGEYQALRRGLGAAA